MRICFIGDSYTNGTGDDDCLGWVGRVCAAARRRGHDLTCYNLGIRRDTSADISRRWQAEADARLPETLDGAPLDGRLVFSFGINDCFQWSDRRLLTPQDSLAEARSILTRARRRPVLFVGPAAVGNPLVDERIAALTPMLAALCAELAIPFLDLYSPLAANRAWSGHIAAGDGIHPTAAGYAVIADLVEAWPAWRAWVP